MKTKYLLVFSAISAGLLVSNTALADASDYDFLAASYQNINDPSGSQFSSDHAFALDASYAFTENLLGQLSYGHETADVKFGGLTGSASGDEFSAGLGWRLPVSSRVDIVPNLSYVSDHGTTSLGGLSTSSSDTGYDAGVELRAILTDEWELEAGIDHSHVGGSSNSFGLGVLYNFAPTFALGLAYGTSTSDGQNTSAWTLTGRFYFGK